MKDENDLFHILERLKEGLVKDLKNKEKPSSEQGKEILKAIAGEEVATRTQQRELREEYAKKSFWFMSIWSIVLLILLFIFRNQVTEWVLISLIGSTTVSLFQMFSIIMKGLFKK